MKGEIAIVRILMIIYCADPLEDNALLSPLIFCQQEIKKMVPIKNTTIKLRLYENKMRHNY
jgi:hypothetical protein